MHRSSFTPEAARLALLRVEPAAERMCRLVRLLERARPESAGPDQPVGPRYFALVLRLERVLQEIRRAGAGIADVRRGRLYFPARRYGRDVLLCWSVGSDRLRVWRDLSAGPGVVDEGPCDAV